MKLNHLAYYRLRNHDEIRLLNPIDSKLPPIDHRKTPVPIGTATTSTTIATTTTTTATTTTINDNNRAQYLSVSHDFKLFYALGFNQRLLELNFNHLFISKCLTSVLFMFLFSLKLSLLVSNSWQQERISAI